MARTGWALIVDDTGDRVEAITPSVDPSQKWRRLPRGRPEGEGGRDREFSILRWSNAGDVAVFGGGEDQLARDLLVETWYTDATGFADRCHADEQDLVAALEKESGYPSRDGGYGSYALKVRRVQRSLIEIEEQEGGGIRVTYPVRLIWREDVSRL